MYTIIKIENPIKNASFQTEKIDHTKKVIFDMTQITYISPQQLFELQKTIEAANAKGIDVRLALNPGIIKLFVQGSFYNSNVCFDDLHKAKASFNKRNTTVSGGYDETILPEKSEVKNTFVIVGSHDETLTPQKYILPQEADFEKSSYIQEYQDPLKQQPKETLGRYVINEKIGEGGMGIIYKAYDPNLDRTIALKVLKRESKAGKKEKLRFLREAKASAKLQHAHIISIHDIDFDEKTEQFFFVMDFIDGVSLKECLQNQIPLLELLDVIIKICKAVAYAHQQEMIHRDLKPANIMINSIGEPLVMDFGLVKMLEESLRISQSNAILGTLHYMAPEQAQGVSYVDKRSDIYSLGVILYEILTKQLPFTSETRSNFLYKLMSVEATPPKEINKEIPLELSNICMKSMAKDKKNRYSSTKELIAVLENFQKKHFSPTQLKKLATERTHRSNITRKRTRESNKIGQKFKDYTIKKILKKNDRRILYRVYDQKLSQDIILKIFLASLEKDFLAIAEEAKSIKHPNVIEIYEIEEIPENYITMEEIKGKSLLQLINENFLTPQEISGILKQCCGALDYAHQKEIIHGYLSPNDIILENNIIPKIANLGMDTLRKSDLENVKRLPYIPPEQIATKTLTVHSDIYALGAILYTALTKIPPFQGNDSKSLMKQCINASPIEPSRLNISTPKELEIICLKCLEKKAKDRYPSMQALAQALEHFVNNGNSESAIVISTKKYTKKSIFAVAVASVLFVALLFYWQFSKQTQIEARVKKQQKIFAQSLQKIKTLTQQIQKNKKLVQNLHQKEKAAYLQIAKIKNTQQNVYQVSLAIAEQYNHTHQLKGLEKIIDNTTLFPPNLRNWEWHWQKNQKHLEINTKKTSAPVKFITTSKNGTMLAWCQGKDVIVENLDIGNEICKLENTEPIISCHFAPNNKDILLVTKSQISLWNIVEKKLIKRFLYFPQLMEISNSVFDPSGKNIVTGYRHKTANKQKKTLILWNVASGKISKSWQIKENINWCDFSHNGRFLLTCGEEGRLHIWKVFANKKIVFKFSKQLSYGEFSPNSKHIVSIANNDLVLWNLQGKKRILKGHKNNITQCQFSPTGKYIVSADQDGLLIRWRNPSGKKIQTLTGHLGAINSICYTSDNQNIISGGNDRSIKMWYANIDCQKPLVLKYKNSFSKCTFHPNANLLAITSNLSTPVLINYQDYPKIKLDYLQKVPNYVKGLSSSFSPVEDIIASNNHRTVYIWSISTKKLLATFKPNGEIKYCVFHPQKSSLLTVGEKLTLWNIKTKQIQRQFPHTDFAFYAKFSPDGNLLATAHKNSLNIFDLQKQQMQKLPFANVKSCSFSPDSKKIVIAYQNKLVSYNFINQKQIAYVGHTNIITNCSFSADGKRIVSSANDHTIRIWDATSNQSQNNALLVLKGHQSAVYSDISNDNNAIVSVDLAGEIRIWNIAK